MQFKKITRKLPEYKKAAEIYQNAFPSNEKGKIQFNIRILYYSSYLFLHYTKKIIYRITINNY